MAQICPLRIGKRLDKKEKKESSKAKENRSTGRGIEPSPQEQHDSPRQTDWGIEPRSLGVQEPCLNGRETISRTEGVNGPDGPTGTDVPSLTEEPVHDDRPGQSDACKYLLRWCP